MLDFRNYTSRTFDLDKGINVFWGANSVGKTNILEAIYLLGVGESFRAKKTEEMIRFGSEFAQVRGQILKKDEIVNQEVILSAGIIMGKKVNKKKYLVNGASKRKADAVGIEKMIVFRPEDVDLVSGIPDLRRKFLDRILIQISAEYGRNVTSYEQALKRRNKILSQIRDGEANAFSLTFWDGLLMKYGDLIQVKRRELIGFINELFERSDMFSGLKIDYINSPVTEARLKQHAEAERAIGYTLVGPHKDDWVVFDKGRRLDDYGSRGEQRMAVLALKMGEIYFLEKWTGEKVLLLLDDVFSELDEVHKTEVLRLMKGRQVLLTTADKDDLDLFDEINVVELK